MSLDTTKLTEKITYNGVEIPIKEPIGWIDGTLETFNAGGVEIVAPYRCYLFENLKSVDLTGVKEVGERAFTECQNIENLVLGEDITKVGASAFYGASQNVSANIEFCPSQQCALNSGAFANSGLIKIKGNFSSIGSNALTRTQYAQEVDIVCHYGLTGSTFEYMGYLRENPETKIFKLNFENSSEFSVSYNVFQYTKYMEIKLPKTIISIDANAFANSDNLDVYLPAVAPPTTSSSTFKNATNIKVYVPKQAVSFFKLSTNWTTVADSIIGVDIDNQFEQVGIDITNGTTLTAIIDCEIADNLLACVITRSASETPTGWTLLASAPSITASGTTQYLNLYAKTAISTTESITITQASSGRLYANIVNIKDKTASVLTDLVAQYVGEQVVTKPTANQMLLFTGIVTASGSTAQSAFGLVVSGDYDELYGYGNKNRLSMVYSNKQQGSIINLTPEIGLSDTQFNTIGVELN